MMARFSQISGIDLPGLDLGDSTEDPNTEESTTPDHKSTDDNQVPRPSKAKRRRRRRRQKVPIGGAPNAKQVKKTLDSLNQIKASIEEAIPPELIESLTKMFGNLMGGGGGLDLSKIEDLIKGLSAQSSSQPQSSGQGETAAETGTTHSGTSSSTVEGVTMSPLDKLKQVRRLELLRRQRQHLKETTTSQ